MSPRRLTISCPGCLDEFKDILVDEAERILFHGCDDCRSEGRKSPMDEIEDDAEPDATAGNGDASSS